jgi:hypothetical protein
LADLDRNYARKKEKFTGVLYNLATKKYQLKVSPPHGRGRLNSGGGAGNRTPDTTDMSRML